MTSGARCSLALLIGLTVGIVVMVFVNVVVNHHEYFGPFGVFFGSFSGLVAFGLTLAFVGHRAEGDPSQKRPAQSRVGLLIAAVVSGIFGLLVLNFNIAWGFSLWSLEGAWLWPLATVPLLSSFALFRAYRGRRSRRRLHRMRR